MTPLHIATAGAALLALLAGCMPAPQPAAPAATETLASATPAPAIADDPPATPIEDAAPRRGGGGAFGIGIRPTGSTPTGITP